VAAAYSAAVQAARDVIGARRWRRVLNVADLVARYAALREEQAEILTLPWPALRRAVQRLGGFLAADGVIPDASDVWFLTEAELTAVPARGPVGEQPPREPEASRSFLSAQPKAQVPGAALGERRRRWQAQQRLAPPLSLGRLPRLVATLMPATPAAPAGALVSGQPASVGRGSGPVLVAPDLAAAQRLVSGEVLVAPLVTPAWRSVVTRAVAVVTDSGTLAAHSALICRELGVPMIVATGDATRRLLDGEVVTVDGTTGAVHRHHY
jgi:pyruvate,water dikinase